MKSSVLILLSLLLATAILAPSVITLTNIDEKIITIDFNEEEKKEEKKEISEIDFLLSIGSNLFSSKQNVKTIITDYYLEGNSNASVAIYLPPPRVL